MSRSAEFIHTLVVLSEINTLSCMAEIERHVKARVASAPAGCLSGMVLAGVDRWVGLIEGPFSEVEYLWAQLKAPGQLRSATVLLSDAKTRNRMFPHLDVAWRNGVSVLEMSAFVSDMRRHNRRGAQWLLTTQEIARLLEPGN